MASSPVDALFDRYVEVLCQAGRTANAVHQLEQLAATHRPLLDRVNGMRWSPTDAPQYDSTQDAADLLALRNGGVAGPQIVEAIHSVRSLTLAVQGACRALPAAVPFTDNPQSPESEKWTVQADEELRRLASVVHVGQPDDRYPSCLPRLGRGIAELIVEAMAPVERRFERLKSMRNLRRTTLAMGENAIVGADTCDELLTFLAGQPGESVAVSDLPAAFRDADLLTVCDADGLIVFGKRKHCWVGSDLRIAKGWEFSSLTGPKKKPMSQILDEALSFSGHEQIRPHVRLTAKGRVRAARLNLTNRHSSPARGEVTPAESVPSSTPAMPGYVRMAGESLEWIAAEHPELSSDPTSGTRYTRAQYDYIVDHGCPAYSESEGGNPSVPNYPTWSRYVRRYLELCGNGVETPGHGRAGRSIVNVDGSRSDGRGS
jgi:hypothetical protein